MTLKILTRKRCWFALVLAVCAVNRAFAQADSARIAFLHLKMDSNQVTLVSASVVPGVLKVLPAHQAAIDLEVATADGRILWTNGVANPLIRRLEFEDPDHPGVIINKMVQFTNAEFSVRVPVVTGADHVSFYLWRAATGTNAPGARPPVAGGPVSERKLLGKVSLPQENK